MSRGKTPSSVLRVPCFHSSLDTLLSCLPIDHRLKIPIISSSSLIRSLNNLFRQPMLHSFVAPTHLPSRTSRDVKKTNVLYSAESSITLFDVRTDRVCTAYLLRD